MNKDPLRAEDLSIKELEDLIFQCFTIDLIKKQQLTQEDVIKGDFSNALAAYEPRGIPTKPEDRKKSTKLFALAMVENAFIESKDVINQKVCVEWEFCNNRENLQRIATFLDGVFKCAYRFSSNRTCSCFLCD